jgi:hypothetical protein
MTPTSSFPSNKASAQAMVKRFSGYGWVKQIFLTNQKKWSKLKKRAVDWYPVEDAIIDLLKRAMTDQDLRTSGMHQGNPTLLLEKVREACLVLGQDIL